MPVFPSCLPSVRVVISPLPEENGDAILLPGQRPTPWRLRSECDLSVDVHHVIGDSYKGDRMFKVANDHPLPVSSYSPSIPVETRRPHNSSGRRIARQFWRAPTPLDASDTH